MSEIDLESRDSVRRTEIGEIEGLFLHPVKNMLGYATQNAVVTPNGFDGDRVKAIRVTASGSLKAAKSIKGLGSLKAIYDGDGIVEIIFPDGRTIRSDRIDVSVVLSEFVGQPIELVGLGDDTVEPEQMHEKKPLPPRQTLFDSYPLMLLSRQSLESLSTKVGSDVGQIERYRPNILVNLHGDSAFPEFDLIGRDIAVGEAVIRIEMPCARCLVVAQGTPSLPRNPDIMKTMLRETDGNLGVYARVLQPGRLQQGDRICFVN